jgi:tetratricopeptide (TPR) repeat protein
MIFLAFLFSQSLLNSRELPAPLDLTPEIRAELQNKFGHVRDSKVLLQDLISFIFDADRLNLHYGDGGTLTAAQTFRARSANCMSFTNLFIALARERGLRAYYKEVIDFSTYDRAGELVRHNRHMIAAVLLDGRIFDFDFEPGRAKRYKRTRLVSDERGFAHFYNNLGAEAFAAGDESRARLLFEHALALDGNFVPAQINLGLFFRRNEQPDKAIALYRSALKRQPRNFSALANLTRLYQETGREQEAEQVFSSMRSIFNRNPYFHFQMGDWAMLAGRFEEARGHFRRAVDLGYREPLFHHGLARAAHALGEEQDARRHLAEAASLARLPELKDRYASKLELLASLRSRP